jgi:hypothetical protein
VYLCMPTKGFKGNRKAAMTVKVPGSAWYTSEPQLVRFFQSPHDAASFCKKLETADVEISNRGEVIAKLQHLTKIVPKMTKMSVQQFFESK